MCYVQDQPRTPPQSGNFHIVLYHCVVISVFSFVSILFKVCNCVVELPKCYIGSFFFLSNVVVKLMKREVRLIEALVSG